MFVLDQAFRFSLIFSSRDRVTDYNFVELIMDQTTIKRKWKTTALVTKP
jgi:hypothetical protein